VILHRFPFFCLFALGGRKKSKAEKARQRRIAALQSALAWEHLPMIDGPSVLAALKSCGVTHVTWVPDTELGRWEAALSADTDVRLIRVCREGEAIAIAGGLLLGGKRPVVLMQCTGLFEAGDSLRNIVHDMNLPLFLVVGVRSWKALHAGGTADTCPRFTEPILRAWGLPCTWLGEQDTAGDLAVAYRQAQAERRAGVALLPE
jgi:sulfopyruvate decarboxylase TPP-binding subunit